MQAAHITDEFIAGAQVKMIGVAQDKRGVDVLEMFGREGLDRRLRANRCEDWRDEVTVRGGEDARAGAIVFGCDGELEHAMIITGGRRD